jgi:hypothetical protein
MFTSKIFVELLSKRNMDKSQHFSAEVAKIINGGYFKKIELEKQSVIKISQLKLQAILYIATSIYPLKSPEF